MEKKYKLELGRALPRPTKPTTNITWNELVDVIADSEIWIAKAIRYHQVKTKGGTAHMEGKDMLKLWKAVEREKKSRAQNK